MSAPTGMPLRSWSPTVLGERTRGAHEHAASPQTDVRCTHEELLVVAQASLLPSTPLPSFVLLWPEPKGHLGAAEEGRGLVSEALTLVPLNTRCGLLTIQSEHRHFHRRMKSCAHLQPRRPHLHR